MLKRRIISILALGMALSMLPLSGCAKTSKTTANDNITTDASGRQMVGNMYTTSLPIVKDKVTFKLVTSLDPRQAKYEDMDLFKQLEQKTNIHIDWEYINSADFTQKKNLILASGQYPDAFFQGIGTSDISVYAPQGVLIQLDDLIKKYAPNVQKAYQEKPIFKQVSTYDGHIYSLGSGGEDPTWYNPDQMFINKAWLDKLGLKMPTTPDELYSVLKAFKDNDPNGNGKHDEIPLSFRIFTSIRGINSLFGWFGRVDPNEFNDIRSHMVVDNGKVVYTADKPEYKQAIQYLHKFFADGLFDPEGFTQDDKQYFAKGKTPEETLGTFFLWNAENMVGPDRKKDYAPVPPLKGSSGSQLWTKYNFNTGMISGAAFSITSACKNPEILMRWVDQFYDKKTSIQAIWGPVQEGSDGLLHFVTPPQGTGVDEFRYKNSTCWGPAAVFQEDFGKVVETPPLVKSKYDIEQSVYVPYMKNETLPQMNFTKEEIDWNSSTAKDILNYVNDMQTKWLLKGGIDNDWDAYLAKLKQLGVDQLVNRMQTAYDRFSKK